MPNTPEWFSEWFDSPYYHILYRDRNDDEAKSFLDNLMTYLDVSSKKRILDLACGRGRHAIYLNQKGYRVVGADLSKASIDFASQFANEKLQFLQWDMRDVFVDEMTNFALVLNLFTSFGYFENSEAEEKVLRNILAATEKKGTLVIDFLNANYVLATLVAEEEKTIDGIRFEIKRYLSDGFIRKDIKITDGEKELFFSESVRALKLADFEALIAKSIDQTSPSKWQISQLFGDYALNPYDAQNSSRLIIVLNKQEI